MTDDLRQEMLQEVLEFNAAPVARPGDLTAADVVEAFTEAGGTLSRTQAYRWLEKMEETAGWATDFVLINGHKTKVWRKPAKE